MIELKSSKPDSGIKTFKEISIRRDIYEFIKFIKNKDIVLTKRYNNIPVPVARKLSKLMSFKEDTSKVVDDYSSTWINLIHTICKKLDLVNKEVDSWVDDITGYYYRKWERPSYPEFDIHLIDRNWSEYLELDPFEKERKILDALCYVTGSEFYNCPVYKRCDRDDRFSEFGSGVNAQQYVKYPPIRKKLLDVLALVEEGKWYETGSLITYIRKNYPNLILDHNNRGHVESYKAYNNFYHSFYETKDKSGWGRDIEVHENDKDAYERVEGRYINYFLETIPFMMNLVELAYTNPLDILPPRGHITHFRLTLYGKEILSGMLQRDKPSHKKILPTFEVFIPMDEFDEKIILRLDKYTKTLATDKMYHLKIDKKSILSELEKGEQIWEIINFFEGLAGLPQNIRYELESYGLHSEKIVSLPAVSIIEVLDSEASRVFESNYSDYIVSKIDNGYFLVKGIKELYERLLLDGRLPRMRDYNAKESKLDLCYASDNMIELKFRNSDIFLKKRLTACANFIKTDENKQVYGVKARLDIAEKNFLRSNILGELPDFLRIHKSEKPKINFDMAYLIYSENKDIIESLDKFLKNKKLDYYSIDDKLVVMGEDIKVIKSHINSITL